MTIALDDQLPTPVDHYRGDFYGDFDIAPEDVLVVIHYSVSDPSNAAGLANYCHSNPYGYRWQRSIGSDGQEFRCGHYDEIGAHDAGLNYKSIGIEHTARSGTQMMGLPKMLNASARLVADFCLYSKRTPSRDFIIGHYEDARFGGTSTHTDPLPGFDWTTYMELVNAWYAKLKGTPATPAGGEDNAWLLAM